MKKTAEMTVAELNGTLFGTSDARAIATPVLIQKMLDSGDGISDLVFSPGRPPQVERYGELVHRDDRRAAGASTGRHRGNRPRSDSTTTRRTCARCSTRARRDLSYALPDRCRFRVNVFRQRGSFAIVMRMIAQKIPSIQDLGLPPAIADCGDVEERHRARDRADRIGQVVDAGRDHRPDQRPTAPITSSPSRIRSSSCTSTRRARSTSASCTPTRRPSPSRCARRCARRRRSSWSARCAIARRSRSR